jgi:hypothetical protein
MPLTAAAPARRSASGAAAAVLAVVMAAAGCADPRSSASAGPPLPSGPTPAATSLATAPPARQQVVIHGTGDVNLDPDYIPALRARGFQHAWSGLDGLFTADDLTVINLECPVSTGGAPVDKEFTFRCDPAALPAARAAGVDVANLANNHSRDYGPGALLDSITHTRAAGIEPVGVGVDAAAAATPAIVERGGWRIAVLGFGGVVPAADWLAGSTRPGMADGDDIPSMAAAVRAAAARADLVFVTIHWGRARHRAAPRGRSQGQGDDRRRRRRDLRPPRPPAPAADDLQRSPDRLGVGELRVAHAVRGRIAHGRRAVRGGAGRSGSRVPAPRADRLPRPSGPVRVPVVPILTIPHAHVALPDLRMNRLPGDLGRVRPATRGTGRSPGAAEAALRTAAEVTTPAAGVGCAARISPRTVGVPGAAIVRSCPVARGPG